MRNKEYLYTASNKGQNKTHLSVIIPTLNEIAYLPQLLDALAKQTRLPDEIIVADAGSRMVLQNWRNQEAYALCTVECRQ